jgi:hypothetical protein
VRVSCGLASIKERLREETTMIEYDAHARRQLARDRAERLADDHRRARSIRESRIAPAIRRLIAAAAAIRRRRRAAHDPAYRH